MKKLVVLVIVVGAAVGGYLIWNARREPLRVCQRFTEALVRGRLEEASALSSEDLQGLEEARKVFRSVPMDALHGMVYGVDSVSREGDEVRYQLTQSIYFDPPGAQSALGGAMVANFRQKVTVRHQVDGWRIAAFENTFVSSDSRR